ncbi:MAG: DUF3999 domain-containing protein [Gammaproteobacteria bacterium]|nr:DUF3999 domain-containing protein [Gammaproteobacteria bacterium]
MYKFVTLLVLLMALGPLRAAPSQPDFAYQSRLAQSDQALQRVALPIEVVLALARSDLGDLAIFNANGKQLVHSVTHAADSSHELNQQLPFHKFGRFHQQRSKTVTQREQTTQPGSLSELETTQTLPVQSLRKDYLVELSRDENTPAFTLIDLQWTHEPADQILQLKVEVGNELDSLRVIKQRKSLTNRASDDRSWHSIGGIPSGHKYMRLSPVGEVTRFELLRVSGIYQQEQAAARLTHRITPQLSSGENGNIYSFAIPSAVNAEAIRILPAEADSVISGDLYGTRGNGDTRILIRRNYRQHNIDADDIKPSQPVQLPRRKYREIQFSTRTQLALAPTVELSYPPYELIFLGDGNSPYTLAWGNHESEGQLSELSQILQGDLQQAQKNGSLVDLGPIEESGGVSRLAPLPTLPWKKWLLWFLLVLASIITGRMAFKLYREMSQPGSEKSAKPTSQVP